MYERLSWKILYLDRQSLLTGLFLKEGDQTGSNISSLQSLVCLLTYSEYPIAPARRSPVCDNYEFVAV